MKLRSIVAGLMLSVVLACPAFAIRTVPIATGLLRPDGLTAPPGDTHRVFILEQHAGRIRIVRDGELLSRPFLDLTGLIATGGEEQGLLGMAFHPAYATNGFFFVNYSRVGDGATMIVRYHVSADPDSAEPLNALTILTIAQPFANHNGGNIAFGHDGFLYIGMGDGGSEQDPLNYGQNNSVLLAKMLRIDTDHGSPYAIPTDNPFFGSSSVRNEIWATGLRNPWRYSFDRSTGDLYIGDVGQDLWEEIDVQPASSRGGENYGWRLMEGNHCYNPPVNCDPGGLTNPVWEYGHGTGCAVVGGYVYRGSSMPAEVGNYFFGDYCSHRIWSFRYQGGGLIGFQERTAELGNGLRSISAFGEDAAGELYICDLIAGQVLKMVPDSGQQAAPGSPREGPAGGYFLYPNQPNPFNSSTRISFDVERRGSVTLTIYNLLGCPVEKPVNGFLTPGHYSITFDGQKRPSGLYFCELQAPGFRQVERMIALK